MSYDQDKHSADEEPAFDLETATLEQSEFGDTDWGGDGTDLHRPVRAHVLAALVPNNEPYSPPVDALLRLGDARDDDIDERRRALGIGQQHVAQLVRMARDRKLNTADSDAPEVWAPVHAVELLSELNTASVVEDLLPLLDIESDWFSDILTDIFASAGQAAVEPLRRYLLDASRWTYGRAGAADALVELARQHPELRDTVVDALRQAMADAEHNTDAGNGLLLARLLELKATEALPEIRQAFANGRVDEMIAGDWAAVQRTLGLEPDPDDALVAESARRWEERREQAFPAELREKLSLLFGNAPDEYEQLEPLPDKLQLESQQWSAPRVSKAGQQAKKAKHKRKIAAASRKANKKKRK